MFAHTPRLKNPPKPPGKAEGNSHCKTACGNFLALHTLSNTRCIQASMKSRARTAQHSTAAMKKAPALKKQKQKPKSAKNVKNEAKSTSRVRFQYKSRRELRTVVIMRGLPGAGKSTRAQQIAAQEASKSRTVAIHSTDSYLTNPVTGVYRFDATLMKANHDRNFAAFCDSLAADTNTVIVDNTNIQAWHYQRYVDEAEEQGYEVREEVVGEFTRAAARVYAARSLHSVPLDKVMDMLEQWWEEEGGGSSGEDEGEDEFEEEEDDWSE